MTLGPEMFGLKRISEVTSVSRGTGGSSTSNPIALNRRGIVSLIKLSAFLGNPKFSNHPFLSSQHGFEKRIHCFLMMRPLLISQLINLQEKTPKPTQTVLIIFSQINLQHWLQQLKQSSEVEKVHPLSFSCYKILGRQTILCMTGQTRSAPSSTTGTPERRSGSNTLTPIKTTSRIKAKLKKMKVKPSFKVGFHLFSKIHDSNSKNSYQTNKSMNLWGLLDADPDLVPSQQH